MSQDGSPGAFDCDGHPVPDGPANTSALADESDLGPVVGEEASDRLGDRPARTAGEP